MNADEYQKRAYSFVTIGADAYEYALAGLMEEVGEIAGKFAKYQRRNIHTACPNRGCNGEKIGWGLFTQKHLRDEDRKFLHGLSAEVGDALWMLAELCTLYGLSLGRVMERNLRKLDDRKARGVIDGEGDER